MVTVAVMGAGSWGTTLSKVCADAGNEVRLWARRGELVDAINSRGRNIDYLPEVDLPTAIRATSDAREALEGADIVILGVPSQTLRTNLDHWRLLIPSDATVVSLSKGVEKGTLKRMSEVIAEVGEIERERIVVLSGPNLSHEIAAEQPAATVLACVDEQRAKRVQHAIATAYLRPYTNSDVIGTELGGACKNVIALCCGMAAGMNLGDNTLATLITRGVAEVSRLGQALGADPRTLSGLAGIGDLVATCMSPLSRNRSFGERLGRGGTIEEAMKATHGQVAEGVISSQSILALARQADVDMPITEAVVAVCHEGVTVDETVPMLMERDKKSEVG